MCTDSVDRPALSEETEWAEVILAALQESGGDDVFIMGSVGNRVLIDGNFDLIEVASLVRERLGR